MTYTNLDWYKTINPPVPTSNNVITVLGATQGQVTDVDDYVAIQKAIDSLPNGGYVLLPQGKCYLRRNKLRMKQNVALIGRGFGKWSEGTTLVYEGTEACIDFASSNGASAGNFKIVGNSGNYHNFTGIDINDGEWLTIENVYVSGAKIGFDVSGSTKPIYLLRMLNIYADNCLNEGIYIRSTGNWKNGIYISIGDVSDNGIGIRCAAGEGNIIEGKASEIGRNTTCGIKLEGGSWTIKGALWLEGSPVGIDVTGGHHALDGDIRCINPININGGTLIDNSKQMYVQPVYKGINENQLKFWFSFNEAAGNFAYSRTAAPVVGAFTSLPNWSYDNGFFGKTVKAQAGDKMSLPTNVMDWTQDWTILVLGGGAGSPWNVLMVKGSDNASFFNVRYYSVGLQIWKDSIFQKNLPTFPSVDLTQKTDWSVLSYDSVNHKLSTYTNSGKLVESYDFTMPAVHNAPVFVGIAYDQVKCDEFIAYQRLLDPLEIANITSLKTLPNLKNSSINSGTTTQRPTGVVAGFNYFDTTINKPIWWNGTVWKDATGTTV